MFVVEQAQNGTQVNGCFHPEVQTNKVSEQ
jgi:hypothetical protein